MDTIIIRTKDSRKKKVVLDFFKKNRVKAEVYSEPGKKQILKGIEKGFKEVQQHMQGKIKLKKISTLLDEL